MRVWPSPAPQSNQFAYELDGKVGSSPSPILIVTATPTIAAALASGYADPSMVIAHLRVTLLPTRMWFLNRLRLDVDERRARVLRYDAVRDSWLAVATHRW